MRSRLLLLALFVAVAGCGDDDSVTPPTSTTSSSTTPAVAGLRTFAGGARLDGAPLVTKFLGAVVRRDGLVTPCQAELPSVAAGRYRIGVHADPDAAGCGTAGAEVVLWIYVGEQKVFSTAPIPWPDATTTSADIEFSSTEPLGAMTPITELNGLVSKQGIRMPVGTRVEAFIDHTRCAVASVRASGEFTGYILNIVGPASVPGCRVGGTVTFRVDGEAAVESSVNVPDRSGTLDLTVR